MVQGMGTVLLLLTRILGRQRYAKVIVCLTLMAFGISNSEINKKLGTSYTTLRKYKAALESDRIGQLIEFKGKRTQSALDDYEDTILKEFETNPPKTLRDAQERILKLTGLNRSLHRIQVWLKKRAYEVGQ
jgi:transposase